LGSHGIYGFGFTYEDVQGAGFGLQEVPRDRSCRTVDTAQGLGSYLRISGWEGRYKAIQKRGLKLPWREAGPPIHLDDKVDADQ